MRAHADSVALLAARQVLGSTPSRCNRSSMPAQLSCRGSSSLVLLIHARASPTHVRPSPHSFSGVWHSPQAYGAAINVACHESSMIYMSFNESSFTGNSVSAVQVVRLFHDSAWLVSLLSIAPSSIFFSNRIRAVWKRDSSGIQAF